MTSFALCSLILALWLSVSHAALRKKNFSIRETNNPTLISFNNTPKSTTSDDRKAGRSDPPDFVIVTPPAHIVGGGLASTTAYPFFAKADSPVASCGSSLIWPDVILSAGHCIAAFNHPNGRAFIGGTTGFGQENPRETIPIRSWLVHPLYKKPGTGNEEADIMLIFLNRTSTTLPARWNIQPTIPSVGQQLSVIGFGKTSDAPKSESSILKEARMQVISDTTCVNSYLPAIAPSATFCTTTVTGTTCAGDSGGPIMDDSGVILGVASFASSAGCGAGPAGFTRVSAYRHWILTAICNSSAVPPNECPPPIDLPTKAPTKLPTKAPTKRPTKSPTKAPTKRPTKVPTKAPVKAPSKSPTKAPSKHPTRVPTKLPIRQPTTAPVKAPSKRPTNAPTKVPSKPPTKAPAQAPTAPAKAPAQAPTAPAKAPIQAPMAPVKAPIQVPIQAPIQAPTVPAKAPSKRPTRAPTKAPSKSPTKAPVQAPTAPARSPVQAPTATAKAPSKRPTRAPTKVPVKPPTMAPVKRPTKAPTKAPIKSPTKAPTTALRPVSTGSAPSPGAMPSSGSSSCPLCLGLDSKMYAVRRIGLLGRCRSRCVANPTRMLRFRLRWECGTCG